MAGGQQIDSGQGTVTAIPGGISVTGEASSSGVGSAVSGIVLSLRSRKVGGGSSTRALTGSAISHAVGSFGVVPQFPVLGISATGSLGAFGKTRAVAQAGSVSSVEQGSVTGPSGSSALSTNFQITSNVGGSNLPFSLGYAFRQGDVLSGQIATTTDTSNWQCRPMSYWPDGSVRHAIIAGRKTLTAGVAATITLSAGTDPGGTALTESNLSSALPTTVIDAGGFSWTLNSSIGTADRFKTVCTGPVMSYWVYRKPVAGSNHLVLWCEVKLYVGGNVELFPWVENAYLDVAGATNDIRTYTVTVGGVTRFNAVNLDIKHHTRIPLLNTGTGEGSSHSFSHWTGSDPQITPKHNMAYLKATKIVPNYGWTSPASGTLDALTKDYSPNITAGMSGMTSAGGSAAIFGHTSNFADAFYITSGGDIRAYRAMMTFQLSGGSWHSHQRSSSTNEPFTLAEAASMSLQDSSAPNASGTGGENGSIGHWTSHTPSWGAMGWLVTGRWWFADEMFFWNGMQFLYQPSSVRQNASGIFRSDAGACTDRGAAWAMRQLAQCVALAPDSHPCKAGRLASWEANVSWYYGCAIDGTNLSGQYVNNLGFLPYYGTLFSSVYSNYGSMFSIAGWMQMMLGQVFGYVWDLEPSQSATSKSKHQSVRDHCYRLAVGLAGPGDPAAWDYRWFGPFDLVAGILSTRWFTSWNEGYDLLKANLSTAPTGTNLQQVGGTTTWADATYLASFFGQHTGALAYAASHYADGANAAWARVTAASNWTSYTNGFNEKPIYGIQPRAAEAPSWLPAVGTVAQISGATTIRSAVQAVGGSSFPSDSTDLCKAWSGGAIVYRGNVPYLTARGGGHGDGAWNGVVQYGPLIGATSPSWGIFLAASALGDVQNGTNYLDGRTSATHTYNELVGVRDRLYQTMQSGWYSLGNSSSQFVYYTPSGQTDVGTSPRTGSYGGSAHYAGKIYCLGGSAWTRLYIYNIGLASWSQEANTDVWFNNYVAMAVDTNRGALLALAGDSGNTIGAYWDLATLTRSTSGISLPAVTGAFSLEYDEMRDVFVAYASNSLTLYECSAATLASGGGTSWVTRTFTGTTPVAHNANGTYGRFRYVKELRGYIVVPHADSSVYFYRSST